MREIEAGHYERKQLSSRSRLIAWSHTSRFDMARELLAPLAGKRLLDYGSGDGTLIKLVSDEFPGAVGADPIPSQVEDARRRFGAEGSLSFHTIGELHERYGAGSFDVVTCMEVLEHCIPQDVERVLDDLARFVTSSGSVIISVPIEIGPSLLIKQIARRLAALRRMGDYAWTERYSLGELLKMTFATASTAIRRPTHQSPDIGVSHGHKGFNWRALEKRIVTRFRVERRLFSPLGFLGGYFSSQTWFICRPL
jgi:2-polyprenyl-3-methyl-5-hydroxy-6-metoxy-1,4-benzoquinol methylase